jgi:DNA-binding NarL/FixJ family response regulator
MSTCRDAGLGTLAPKLERGPQPVVPMTHPRVVAVLRGALRARLDRRNPEGVGYLLKECVGDVGAFLDAVSRVAAGGSALDPEIVARMLGRRRRDQPLDRLSPRERDVLAAMAEGKSNHGIAATLVVTQAAVEKHVTSIFHKLELDSAATEHRRVLAVLAYLRDTPAHR